MNSNASASDTRERTSAAEVLCPDEVDGATAARAAMYCMLASLYFAELTEEKVRELAGVKLSGMDFGDELMAEGMHDIERYLRRVNSGTRQELACDYAHSMLGAGAYEQRRATPFESVFTSDSGLLMQDARDDVYRLFCQEHLEAREELRIPEDHLSFIFEFMAILCDRMRGAVACGFHEEAARLADVQKELWEHHLANWIDAYCNVLDEVALTRFYRGVAKVTRAFVHADGNFIDATRAALAAN